MGGGPPADLVKDDQALACGVVDYVCGLVHFHHKGALAGGQFVMGAYPGKYPVHHPYARFLRRNETAYLRQQDYKGSLAHIRGFARHIGAGYHPYPAVRAVEAGVVGDKLLRTVLQNGMPAVFDLDNVAVIYRRP